MPTMTPRPQTGYTLVELMVALTLGIVISIGMLTLFTKSSRGFNSQDAFSRLQENGSFALRYLGDAIRHAGFYGYLYQGDVVRLADFPVGTTATVAANNCGGQINWAFDTAGNMLGGGPLAVFNNTAGLGCIDAANYLGGQVLITRSAQRTSTEIAVLEDNTVYVQSDPGGGILFYGKDYPALNDAGQSRILPPAAPAPIYPYRADIYYVRPCSRLSGGVCSAASDNGRPIPTLVRQRLVENVAPTQFTNEPLVEGIEQVRFRYGLDTNGDGVVDIYQQAVTVAQLNQVVTIEVTVLARTPQPVPGHDDSTRSYDIGDAAPFICNGNACRYRRHVFTQTFGVTNLVIRRGS